VTSLLRWPRPYWRGIRSWVIAMRRTRKTTGTERVLFLFGALLGFRSARGDTYVRTLFGGAADPILSYLQTCFCVLLCESVACTGLEYGAPLEILNVQQKLYLDSRCTSGDCREMRWVLCASVCLGYGTRIADLPLDNSPPPAFITSRSTVPSSTRQYPRTFFVFLHLSLEE
jgi:hypothetical protein